ncbi:glycine oxidase ThiO [Synechococcus elongatus IITB7]|uniref:glycine oxidase ThiO n=1 Tax=Synechococcus elongatus TaxID=32046 RepID=UPI0030CF705A
MAFEVAVFGGGVIGLAIALELRSRGAMVQVYSQNSQAAAGRVAAGMLAPQSEGIEVGPMLDLGLRSRSLYARWTQQIEQLSGQDSGYWPCGILVPLSDAANRDRYPHPAESPGQWLAPADLRDFQPALSSHLIGGWWFPQEGQVDSRRALYHALRAAAIASGVILHEGVALRELVVTGDRLQSAATNQGPVQADAYVLATGAWSGDWLQLPVYPVKGQMFSLQAHPDLLRHVLFGERAYIVPRRDGLIVVGATVEATAGFSTGNTAGPLQSLMAEAIALVPALADCPLVETWWGYRPATPDEWPILGQGPAENLFLATGHYRNGMLLAPITAQLLADQILDYCTDPLLHAFRYDRFSSHDSSTHQPLPALAGLSASTSQ